MDDPTVWVKGELTRLESLVSSRRLQDVMYVDMTTMDRKTRDAVLPTLMIAIRRHHLHAKLVNHESMDKKTSRFARPPPTLVCVCKDCGTELRRNSRPTTKHPKSKNTKQEQRHHEPRDQEQRRQ